MHAVLQKLHIPPGELMKKPMWERRFIFASTLKEIDAQQRGK